MTEVVVYGTDEGFFDMVWRVEVGFTQAEADYIVALCPEFTGQFGHFKGFRLIESLQTRG